MTRALGTLVLLAAVVFAVYGRALDAPFIFDDLPTVVENPSIRRLWPLVGDAANPGPLNPPATASTARRPLANLSFALDYRWGGLEPRGYRIVNLVLHVLAAAVLAALVRRTLLLPYFGGAWEHAAGGAAVAVALVWSVHPLATEAVVYVTQRTELLVALCYLTTIWAAVCGWTAPTAAARTMWHTAAVLASLAGMASKEAMASAPLVVALYERTFLVSSWRATRRSWPLYAGLAAGLLVPVGAFAIVGTTGWTDARHHVPPHVWWVTQTKVLLLYLKLTVWPWPLSIHYAPIYLRTFAAAWPWVAALTLLAVATLVMLRRRPAARFVVVAVVLVLGPTLIVPLAKMVAAERRMYLPLAGLVALAVVGGHRAIASRFGRRGDAIAAAALATLVLSFSVVTALRLRAYESAITIWEDATRHQPEDAMAHYNLGVALFDAGRPPAETLPRFARAVELDPKYSAARDNLGMVLNALGRRDEARAQFEQSLRIDPNGVVAHNNIGAGLIALGRPAEALPHLRRALALQPDGTNAQIHLNLGKALLATGRVDEAVEHLDEVARRAPGDPDIQVDLANACMQMGDAERAVAAYRTALAQRPDDAFAHNNLGAALMALGRSEEAIPHFEASLRTKPDRVSARYNLGRVLLATGRADAARAHLAQAVAAVPEDGQVRFTYATALAEAGATAEAVVAAEEARELARAGGKPALAEEIDAWLAAHRAPAPR